MGRLPTNRPPTHPGEILRYEFLEPLDIKQSLLADCIRVPFQRVNEIVNGKRGITPSTALRLAKFFGTSPEVWLGLQLDWDLWHARRDKRERAELNRITKYSAGERCA